MGVEFLPRFDMCPLENPDPAASPVLEQFWTRLSQHSQCRHILLVLICDLHVHLFLVLGHPPLPGRGCNARGDNLYRTMKPRSRSCTQGFCCMHLHTRPSSLGKIFVLPHLCSSHLACNIRCIDPAPVCSSFSPRNNNSQPHLPSAPSYRRIQSSAKKCARSADSDNPPKGGGCHTSWRTLWQGPRGWLKV